MTVVTRAKGQSAKSGHVVGYVRVSTAEQSESGLGLAAQRHAIEAECERRGWTLVDVFEDSGVSGKSIGGRAGLAAALEAVRSEQAEAVVVAKLDRLSRSLADFAALMATAKAERWNLVALDLGIDLGTAAGEFMANVMASAAQWERRIIGQRTRDALAAKRSQGAKLGRPAKLPEHVVKRIVEEKRSGKGWSEIARGLDADAIPTSQGGRRWYPATVRSVFCANVRDDAA
jgi:DNA invertase Pin-like site-specific DNA recombinase